MRRFAVAVLLAMPVLVLLVLLVAPTLLEAELPGDLPLGNLLVALALAAWPAAAAMIAAPRSAARRFAGFALVLALAWLPVSAALAGNLALNFAGERGTAWLAFSLAVSCAGVVSVAWSVFHHFKIRKTK